MAKADILREYLTSLQQKYPTDSGIMICGLDEKPLEQKVRLFYEAHPYYHQELLPKDMERRVVQQEQDWANWIIPVKLEGQRTLDVGCGCGFNLALHGALAEVAVGVDVSLNALHLARQYLVEQGVIDRIFLIRGDIRTLELYEGAFDLITCVGVLHHIPDHANALANMARLLDTEGVLLIGLYHPGGRFWHRLKRQVLRLAGRNPERQMCWAKRLFDIRGEAQYYRIPEEIYLRDSYVVPFEKAFSVREIARELGQVGLTLVQVRPSPAIAFEPGVEQSAQRQVGRNGCVNPVDVRVVDRSLTRMRRHHYWCLARK